MAELSSFQSPRLQPPSALSPQVTDISTFVSGEIYDRIGGQPAIYSRPFEIVGNSPLEIAIYLAQRSSLALVQAYKREARLMVHIQNLSSRLEGVESQLIHVSEECALLRKATIYVLPLNDLTPEPYELTRQIFVKIEGSEDGFTATFIEANISASGQTEADATLNFKHAVVTKFEILSDYSDEKLGKLPLRQKAVLSGLIRRMD